MKEKQYLKNMIILFASMVITKVVGALFKIPLANLLGGTGMGYFSTAYGLYSPVFALTAAGVPTVITRMTARYIAAGNEAGARFIKRTALVLFGCIGFVGTAAVAVFAKPFAEHIACSPQSTLAIICISPAVMLCCIASVLRGYYEGMSNVVPSSVAAAAEAVSRAVFGLGMAYAVVLYANKCFYSDMTVFGISCSSAEQAYEISLPYAAAGAVLAVSISELCGLISLIISDRKNRRLCKEQELSGRRCVCVMLLREAAPIAAFALVMNCVSFVDLLTVTRTLGNCAQEYTDYFSRRFSSVLSASGGLSGLPNFMYGSYTGIAMSLYMLIPSFAGMTEKTALPEITAAWTKQDKAALKHSITTLFAACSAIAAPACFGAASLGKPILSMLYNSRPAEVFVCLDSFTILCLGGIFMTVGSAMFGVFQAVGKAHIPLILMTVSVGIKLALNPVLMSIPQLNIAGAAAASVVGYVFMAVSGYLILRKMLGSMGIIRTIIPPVLSGAACAVCARLVYNTLEVRLSNTLNTIIAIACGGFVYILLLIFHRGFCASNTISLKSKKKFEKPLAKFSKIG